MKRKTFLVTVIGLTLAGVGTLAAGCGTAASSYKFDEYKRIPGNAELYQAEKALLDGKFDEEIWKSAKWHAMTSCQYNRENGNEQLGFSDCNYEATVVTDAKGVYVGMKSDDPSLYVGRSWNDPYVVSNQVPGTAFGKTGFSIYLSDKKVQNSGHEIGFSVDGDIEAIRHEPGRRIRIGNYDLHSGIDLRGAKLNDKNTDGYAIEIFMPWSALPYTEGTPDTVSATFASHRYDDFNLESTQSQPLCWELLDRDNGHTWLNPSSWLEYGNSGLKIQREGEVFGMWNETLSYDADFDLSKDVAGEDRMVTYAPVADSRKHAALYVKGVKGTELYAEATIKIDKIKIGNDDRKLFDSYCAGPLDTADFADIRTYGNIKNFDPLAEDGFKMSVYRNGDTFYVYYNDVLHTSQKYEYVTADVETYMGLYIRNIGATITKYTFLSGDDAIEKGKELGLELKDETQDVELTVNTDNNTFIKAEGVTVNLFHKGELKHTVSVTDGKLDLKGIRYGLYDISYELFGLTVDGGSVLINENSTSLTLSQLQMKENQKNKGQFDIATSTFMNATEDNNSKYEVCGLNLKGDVWAGFRIALPARGWSIAGAYFGGYADGDLFMFGNEGDWASDTSKAAVLYSYANGFVGAEITDADLKDALHNKDGGLYVLVNRTAEGKIIVYGGTTPDFDSMMTKLAEFNAKGGANAITTFGIRTNNSPDAIISNITLGSKEEVLAGISPDAGDPE